MAKVVGVFSEEKVDHLLDQGMLDKATRRKLASFLEQIEVAVFTANREIIHRAIPGLDRDSFVRFAVAVAEARASYAKLGLELTRKGQIPPKADLDRLKEARETYEELMHAFEATHRLIKRGYSSVA
ncbi:MAG: hypothetical protein JNM30_16805 [Rhodospirillales bacterium]|nr:hypothetical protein [Rhodospirillales bacterium]